MKEEEYKIIDISGRVIKEGVLLPREMKEYNNKSGIYYIINKEERIIGKAILLR